jgi:hypothetical protein
LIMRIAETHGGKLANGDKDKIENLLEVDDAYFDKIRPRLIAAILRFADELADDKTRANSTALTKGLLPVGSEVFHAYAMCLDSVKVNHKENSVDLKYQIPKHFLLRTFGKVKEGGVEQVLLMDEIYERLLKMHSERVYCMRYCKGSIDIDKIRVRIEFYSNTYEFVHHPITFEIRERGYPGSGSNIFNMCPELSFNDMIFDGKYFKNKLEQI